VPLGDAVAARVLKVALGEVKGAISIDVIVVDRSGQRVGHAGF
jgi:hypothetical protein